MCEQRGAADPEREMASPMPRVFAADLDLVTMDPKTSIARRMACLERGGWRGADAASSPLSLARGGPLAHQVEPTSSLAATMDFAAAIAYAIAVGD